MYAKIGREFPFSEDVYKRQVDSIANSKKDPEEEVLEGMQEDVYSFGNTDYTSGFWTAFSKYYVCLLYTSRCV